MTAPQFVSSGQSAWDSTATPKTLTMTVNAGNMLVVKAVTEQGEVYLSTPTGGTGFTWTLQQVFYGDSQQVGMYVWTAPVTEAQSVTLSVGRESFAGRWGFAVEQWSQCGGIGALVATQITGTATTTLTTTGANSAISAVFGDWNATTGTRSYATINGGAATESGAYPGDALIYGTYAVWWADAGTPGSKTVAMSAPTGQRSSIIAIELLGLAGSVTASASLTATATVAATGARTLHPGATTTATATTASSAALRRPGAASLAVAATTSAAASITASVKVQIAGVSAYAQTAPAVLIAGVSGYSPTLPPTMRIASVLAANAPAQPRLRVARVEAVVPRTPRFLVSSVQAQPVNAPPPYELFVREVAGWSKPLFWIYAGDSVWADVSAI